MGTLGVPEMIVIFLLALVLFGPKKLPELGRTLGKALTEFRRASTDLKSSFEREMQNLERETESLKDVAHSAVGDVTKHLNYETYLDEDGNPISYDAPAAHPTNTNPPAASNTPSTVGASEVPGAESHGTSETAHSEAAHTAVAALPPVEGTVPRSEPAEPVQHHS